MADLPTGMLDTVKGYLHITWQDDATDAEITGYINRGMARLQQIAGALLDFEEEEQPRALLLDYCRYAHSQALEVFEKNFQSELLDLHLSAQAPLIDSMAIAATTGNGGYNLTVTPTLNAGDHYVYQVGMDFEPPDRLDICMGEDWTVWDGFSPIPATSGQQIMVVELNPDFEAERAGMVAV